MGAVRTTFAMVAACIVRRQQLIANGMDDPYSGKGIGQRSGISTVGYLNFQHKCHALMKVLAFQPLGSQVSHKRAVLCTLGLTRGNHQAPPESRIAQALEQVNQQQDLNRSLLRITYILERRKGASVSIWYDLC